MPRQVVPGEIGVDVGARPVGERVELQQAGAAVEFEARQALARRRLENLASGDRSLEIGERLLQRLYLSHTAEPVGGLRTTKHRPVYLHQVPVIGRQGPE